MSKHASPDHSLRDTVISATVYASVTALVSGLLAYAWGRRDVARSDRARELASEPKTLSESPLMLFERMGTTCAQWRVLSDENRLFLVIEWYRRAQPTLNAADLEAKALLARNTLTPFCAMLDNSQELYR